MQASQLQSALQRLETAPWPSSRTDKAIALLQQNPSENDLLQTLHHPHLISVTLEALCALRLDSRLHYRGVCQALTGTPQHCWDLMESLNCLAWYDGLRVYFESNVARDPRCCLPFYILARNKIFIPSDMCGDVYAYHVRGFQGLINIARSKCWQHLQPDTLDILNMLYQRLKTSPRESFAVDFSTLLLGGFVPWTLSIQRLKTLILEPPHPALTKIVSLTLNRIQEHTFPPITTNAHFWLKPACVEVAQMVP